MRVIALKTKVADLGTVAVFGTVALFAGLTLVAACSPADPVAPVDGGTSPGTGGAGNGSQSSGGQPGSGGMTSGASGGASISGSGGVTPGATGGGGGPSGSGGNATGGAGGESTPSGIPMFVAAGYRGRTTVSCDDGASWVANHSDDDSVCPNHFCGEVANLITGLTFGDGNFFITRGWGMPGNVLRSPDGVAWTQIYAGQEYGGVAYGSGTLAFASGWQAAWYSSNAGQTIIPARDFSGLLGAAGTIRNVSYHPYAGGRFILVPDDGVGLRRFLVSQDLGKTYALGATAAGQDICASRVTDVVSGGDIIVSSSYETGWICRSLDGGATWAGKQVSTASLSRQMLWTGNEFLVYGGGSGYRSTDGDTWTKFALSPSNLQFGAMARSSRSGTIVASSPAGMDYGAQAFYRSSDGIVWQRLAAGKFVGSHLIEHMSFGAVQHSSACPGN